MPRVFENWKDNVAIFNEDAAICWKAAQQKDLEKIRSENSEDVLTWQVFRTLEEHQMVSKWAAECLGIDDEFTVYYWQRQYNESVIDPMVDSCLARVEPIHREHNRQHTETDLILRGRRKLIMVEVKLGYKDRPITGWQQAQNSPIMPSYAGPARLLMTAPDDWKATLGRFAQLYKNLILGGCLKDKWSRDGAALELGLLAIVNGATVERLPDGTSRGYLDEFLCFRDSCTLDQRRLHIVTWQELATWICRQERPELQFIHERLRSHPLL